MAGAPGRFNAVANPLFSVIIPTFNRPELLREAVASVLAQTETDLECIVVDDGGSESLVLPDDPRVRLLRHEENAGGAAAFNTGIGAARGEYVAFLDDDDVFLPQRLAVVVSAHDDADIVLCATGWLDGGRSSPPRDLQGNVFDSILDGITPHNDSVSVRRNMVLRFDDRYRASYDVEWWLRMTETRSVRSVPTVGALIRRHGGLRHGNDADVRASAAQMLFAERADYFARHPRAAAFRWFRLGLQSERAGDLRGARRALLTSLKIRWRLRPAAHLVRLLLVPGRLRVDRRVPPTEP